MFILHSTHNQKDIKSQIRNILDWKMDCNIESIGIFPENTRVFNIRTNTGYIWKATIKYHPDNKTTIFLE